MMYNESYHFWGMHSFWWVIWLFLIFWIFVTPYNIPGQRIKKETPLDILKKRYAKGEINNEEYQDKKSRLDN